MSIPPEEQLALFDLPEPATPQSEQPCFIYADKRLGVVGPVVGAWTEAQLQEAVEKLCRTYGRLFHHCQDSRLCHGIGFPDLVIAGPGGTLYRELKVRGREPAFEQRRWGRILREAGQDWKIWTETDYASGLIAREIAMLGQPKAA